MIKWRHSQPSQQAEWPLDKPYEFHQEVCTNWLRRGKNISMSRNCRSVGVCFSNYICMYFPSTVIGSPMTSLQAQIFSVLLHQALLKEESPNLVWLAEVLSQFLGIIMRGNL